MAVPKKRKSRSKKMMKRAHSWKLTATQSIRCPQCGDAILPHRVCPHCGHYKGRAVISFEPL